MLKDLYSILHYITFVYYLLFSYLKEIVFSNLKIPIFWYIEHSSFKICILYVLGQKAN